MCGVTESRHPAALAELYGCWRPGVACACLYVSHPGTSSTTSPPWCGSRLGMYCDMAQEREPSKTPPKGSDAATGEGWGADP